MSQNKLRIVIIDDEECIRESLAMHLTEAGHEAITYADPMLCPPVAGHDCRNDDACADLYLIDYNMPGMTGLELLRQLTRKGCHVLPPNRVIMTGYVTPEIESATRKMGCHFIQKPLRFDQLDRIIDKARMFLPADRKLADLG